MKFLKVLIVLSLLLFPFGELLRFELGNNIVIKPLDVIVGVASLCLFFFPYVRQSFHKNKKIFLPIAVFSGIGFGSLLLNSVWLQPNEFFASLLYLVRWISYALLVFIILQFDKQFKKKITYLLFFDGLLILLLGYLQYFFYPNLKSLYHLGWDEHMHRMFSSFFDPNFAGAFFVLFFVFLAGALLLHLNKKERNKSIILGVLLIITLLAIFLTFSRAALLMLLVSSGIFLILINKKKLIFLIIGAICLFALSISSQFYIENMNLFREASSKARLSNYTTAIEIGMKEPLFGTGFNSYRYAKTEYGIQSGWTGFPSHADAGVDNSFLFVFVTTGIIGLAAYLWMWSVILKKAYSSFKKKKDISSVVLLSSASGLFINALFINSLFFPACLLWMWCLVGLEEN